MRNRGDTNELDSGLLVQSLLWATQPEPVLWSMTNWSKVRWGLLIVITVIVACSFPYPLIATKCFEHLLCLSPHPQGQGAEMNH